MFLLTISHSSHSVQSFSYNMSLVRLWFSVLEMKFVFDWPSRLLTVNRRFCVNNNSINHLKTDGWVFQLAIYNYICMRCRRSVFSRLPRKSCRSFFVTWVSGPPHHLSTDESVPAIQFRSLLKSLHAHISGYVTLRSSDAPMYHVLFRKKNTLITSTSLACESV